MKSFFLITAIFLFFSAIIKNPVSSQNFSLTIKIKGIENLSGNIQIGLYNKADDFPKVGGEYKITRLKITANEMSCSFSLPAGNYAVALFHDENSDFECNTNWLGIPSEGYGFSNNVKPVLSPPSFSEAKISLFENTTISIDLIY